MYARLDACIHTYASVRSPVDVLLELEHEYRAAASPLLFVLIASCRIPQLANHAMLMVLKLIRFISSNPNRVIVDTLNKWHQLSVNFCAGMMKARNSDVA